MFKLSDELIKRAEENDFTLYIDKESVSVQRYSTAGQDFCFNVDLGKNKEEFLHNIYECYVGFDADYEATLWIGDDGHGKNGAPYHIVDIVADMEECKESINEFYNIINQS